MTCRVTSYAASNGTIMEKWAIDDWYWRLLRSSDERPTSKNKDKFLQLVGDWWKLLSDAERRYDTAHEECLAVL